MKMKRTIGALLLVFVGLTAAHAQSDVADFLKFGKADANKLVEAYINPYAKTLGVGLNSSWYNTAATHRLWGFDLAFTATAVQISGADKTFDINSLGLQNARVRTGSSSFAPTAAGSGSGVNLDIYVDPNDASTYIGTLKTPGGSGVSTVPIPMVQFTFGLLPHTDVIGRVVPTVKFDLEDDQAKVGLWGLGIKHNFKESIPFVRHLPFDASFILAYSKLSAKTGIDFGFENYGFQTPQGYIQDENQRGETETSTFKYGLILSKKLSVMTFYASASGNNSKTSFDLLGRYPMGTEVNGTVVYDDITNPVMVDIKNNYFAVDAGFRLKLAFFSLFGSVAKADYTTYTAGLSFGFR